MYVILYNITGLLRACVHSCLVPQDGLYFEGAQQFSKRG